MLESALLRGVAERAVQSRTALCQSRLRRHDERGQGDAHPCRTAGRCDHRVARSHFIESRKHVHDRLHQVVGEATIASSRRGHLGSDRVCPKGRKPDELPANS